MADQEDINEVRTMLGPNSVIEGWSDEKISDELDEGNSPAIIARKYWESRMAVNSNLADVTESGSSRKLQQVFQNAQALAAYYRGAEAAEDPDNQPSGAFCREIRRV